MTPEQQIWWQFHVVRAKRDMADAEILGIRTVGLEAVIAADAELVATRLIVQAAREYVEALAEVTRVYDAGEMTVGDAQAICETKLDGLIAAVGGAADAS